MMINRCVCEYNTDRFVEWIFIKLGKYVMHDGSNERIKDIYFQVRSKVKVITDKY